MTSNRTAAVEQMLWRVCTLRAVRQTDGQLLGQFLARRDEAAFAALVRRHGPMVLGVCRRILGNDADAEDAFQATFLVLVRKAAALAARPVLGDWLHGVARRTALGARRLAARRQAKEQAMVRAEAQGGGVRNDWLPLLDEALGHLPEKYRLPIVLCDLEGRTRREAAERLGWPEGTVAGRQARGRALLVRRMARQGMALSAAALAAELSRQAASACMPAALAGSTVKAARLLAVGGTAAAGAISPRVVALTEGVVKAMFVSKLKMTITAVLVAALLAVGYGASPALEHDHAAHPGDPVKQTEHTALFDLVNDRDATHTAVADGPWGDPKTWDKGTVPGAGSRVVIPGDRTVTVAGLHDKERLDWVRVDGTLRFDPTADTALKVVTLVGAPGSAIEIGTDQERVHADKTAHLILGDRGERDDALRQRDPYDLSGGLISHGRVRLFGAEYTSHATPTAVPRKDETVVRFATAPKGWKVGDKLLFPGLDRQENGRDVSIDPWTGREMPPGQHQDEERIIRALSADGKTVTLDRSLVYQHGDIYGYAEAVPVGNLSRNVVVESENTEKVGRRGHVMFMHTQNVVIDSALFRELGRTNVEGELTSPRVKDGKVEEGSDANTIGRYAVHFHLRWGATYKQQPFVVRNCAVVGSPKLGIVNHGGYGLVDDNVSYRVRGSHFFTENGSEIGRFQGNLAVRSNGTGFDSAGDDDGLPVPGKHAYDQPLNIGHGGHGFWLQGGGVEVTDNVSIGHSYSAYGFFVANNHIVTYGGPQEPHNPLTKGTPWERLDVFLAENLKDPGLAHGKPFVHTSAVPFSMARCVGLASRIGLRTRGIDRTEFLVLHDKQDLVEDCRFVWNEQGYLLGYSPGLTHLRNTQFIGGDPAKGALDRPGIGGGNHIPGYLTLENVMIDGYRTGCVLPARGVHVIQGGYINGIRKLIVPTPWGGKVVVDGVKFGAMKGEEPQPILFGADPTGPNLYGVPPYSNWTRKLQPFEFVYNGRQVYHDDQKPDAVPFDVKDKRWTNPVYGTRDHGPLDGKTGRQLWAQYRLAIGGRLAPAELIPCPDIRGGSFGIDVPFDPPVESEPNTAYYGGKKYEELFGKSSPDDVTLHPRYMYDPILVHTPQKGYVARVRIDGKDYQSEPTDLVAGVNLLPIQTDKLTRYVPVGAPTMLPPPRKGDAGGE